MITWADHPGTIPLGVRAIAVVLMAYSLLVTGPTAGAGQQPAPAWAPVAIVDATVIDVRDGTRVPHQTLVVAGTRIAAIGSAKAVKLPAGARVVDGRGRFMIPGLWDMHAHVHGACTPATAYPLYLANGVTGIRDLNVARLAEARTLRQAVATGARVGPRSVLSSPALDIKTGGAWCTEGPTHLGVATAADARRLVDSLQAAGADLLKVYELPGDVLFPLLAEARRVHIPVGGHLAYGGRAGTAADASDSGYRSIEHIRASVPLCASQAECVALAERLERHGTFVTPTLGVVTYMDGVALRHFDRLRYWPHSFTGDTTPQAVAAGAAWVDDAPDWENERQQVQWLAAAGAPLLAGSDAMPTEPLLPGFTLHDELQLLVKAGGLTPLAALQAATLNPARYLNATDSLGTVAAGKVADLVVLDADPLTAIENTTRIQAVIANGRLFDRPALDALLVDAERLATQLREHAGDVEPAP